MSNSEIKYYQEDYTEQKIEENLSEDVVNILETFKLLSVEDKIVVKRLIKTVDIFA